ncbi:MAG: tetratricopeptide repeat protein [Candidatus Aerophobetes bacterium]
MATQDFRRKLTAILSADVKGYSRLMGEDEGATVRTITAYREVIGSIVQKHRGRVVDSPGDNILAEFASVMDAVRSAVEIQEELKTRNAELPEERKMEFRIGVNLGDLIHEEERIYGDGVNVAARVESLAEAGGICVSGTVFDHIENKLPLGYEYLGERSVKNITKPVRVYKVLMEPGAVGKVIGEEKMAFSLPEKPSLAVLPFDNLSGDSSQDYFGDGITENIITALSTVSNLFVIARNSSFTYKGKPVRVQQVAEELGVRYVLEGSVQRSGDRVRITAQLIDALKGHHLWAENYDRNLKDIFTLQDEVTKEIITALQVKLTRGEQARLEAKGTDNLKAYLKFMQAREYIVEDNIEGNASGRQLAEEAIALDSEYGAAYRLLGLTHFHDTWLGSSKSPKQSLAKAIELVQKAIELDDGYSHSVLGFLLSQIRQYDKAIAEAERGVALNPNSADSHAWLGLTLFLSGRYQEAIPEFEKAIRLNPIPPGWYLHNLGLAYFCTGRHEEGIKECEKAVRQKPDSLYARLELAAVYGLSGRDEEARAEATEVLRMNPKFSLEELEKRLAHKNQEDKERYIGALRKAGLK